MAMGLAQSTVRRHTVFDDPGIVQLHIMLCKRSIHGKRHKRPEFISYIASAVIIPKAAHKVSTGIRDCASKRVNGAYHSAWHMMTKMEGVNLVAFGSLRRGSCK